MHVHVYIFLHLTLMYTIIQVIYKHESQLCYPSQFGWALLVPTRHDLTHLIHPLHILSQTICDQNGICHTGLLLYPYQTRGPRPSLWWATTPGFVSPPRHFQSAFGGLSGIFSVSWLSASPQNTFSSAKLKLNKVVFTRLTQFYHLLPKPSGPEQHPAENWYHDISGEALDHCPIHLLFGFWAHSELSSFPLFIPRAWDLSSPTISSLSAWPLSLGLAPTGRAGTISFPCLSHLTP